MFDRGDNVGIPRRQQHRDGVCQELSGCLNFDVAYALLPLILTSKQSEREPGHHPSKKSQSAPMVDRGSSAEMPVTLLSVVSLMSTHRQLTRSGLAKALPCSTAVEGDDCMRK